MFAVKKYFFFFVLVFIIFLEVIKSLQDIPNEPSSLFLLSKKNNYKEMEKIANFYNFLQGQTRVFFSFMKSMQKN